MDNFDASVGLLMDLLPSIEQIPTGHGNNSSFAINPASNSEPTSDQTPDYFALHDFSQPLTLSTTGGTNYGEHPFDTTRQLRPPGVKPTLTAALWEDEDVLCFQVDAKGVCVTRRDDNHYVNGTKLLNVAGLTRGQRDGILKSEKVQHVVKIGPMHLKGVWIPLDRALEFANKEKITDILYPLFVHHIGGLLYDPEYSRRTDVVVSATEQWGQMGSVDSDQPPLSTQVISAVGPLTLAVPSESTYD